MGKMLRRKFTRLAKSMEKGDKKGTRGEVWAPSLHDTNFRCMEDDGLHAYAHAKGICGMQSQLAQEHNDDLVALLQKAKERLLVQTFPCFFEMVDINGMDGVHVEKKGFPFSLAPF